MVREKYAQAFEDADVDTVFPVAEFTTCVGFFVVLTVEQIVHTFHDSPLLHGSHATRREKEPLLQKDSNEGFRRSSFSNNSIAGQGHPAQESSLRVYILVLALSLHSVFEGIALGLITDIERLAQIAGAIVIHKSIIAFSLSISMVQHEMRTRTIVKSAILFSIMGPIGVGIGMAVLHNSTQVSSSLSSGILQGIANGTFLFVTFFEIFLRELEAIGHRLLKVFFMIIGYTIVTGLVYYANILEHNSPSVHPPSGSNSTEASLALM